jgi:hypothetical protein
MMSQKAEPVATAYSLMSHDRTKLATRLGVSAGMSSLTVAITATHGEKMTSHDHSVRTVTVTVKSAKKLEM